MAFISIFPQVYKKTNDFFSYGKKTKLVLNMGQSEKPSKFSSSNQKPFERKQSHLYLNISVETLISNLQEMYLKENFTDFCFLNREHLSYDLLYRLTVLKLKSEENTNNQNQILKVDGFRKRILETTMVTDQAISQTLILAEKRIKEILNKTQNPEFVIQNIGEDRIHISCFWVVLFAALVAWEKKIGSDDQIANSDTYQKLSTIKEIFVNSEKHQSLLATELKTIQNFLGFENNSNSQSTVGVDCITGLKLLISQLEKLPSSSYGPLLFQVSKFYNKVFFENYGIKNESLRSQNIVFIPKKIKTKSKLVEIQQNK